MNTELIHSGGVQKLSRIQYVYLDFDGESTSYNGELLTIDKVELTDSLLTREEIRAITADLNARYSNSNVLFVTDRPFGIEFSTVYIGYTDDLGDYSGLAETIDHGNQNASDNAFVILRGGESIDQIADTIAHETDHIVFGLDHGGEFLAAYAATYRVESGVTSTGAVVYSGNALHVSSGGLANNTIVSGGELYISSGGVANSTTVRLGNMTMGPGGVANDIRVSATAVITIHSGGVANNISGGNIYISSGGVANEASSGNTYVSSGGVANNTTVDRWYKMYISSGGVANNTVVNFDGNMYVSSGGVANGATVTWSANMYISSGGTATNVVWTPCLGIVSAADGAHVTYASTYSGCYLGSYENVVSQMTSMSSQYLHSKTIYVFSGGVADNLDIRSCTMYIHSGGMANNTQNTGIINIHSGGVANNTQNSNIINIHSGGVANDAIMSGGSMYIASGGVANNTRVKGSAGLYVASGGTATNVIWTPCFGVISSADGAHVTYASTYSGCYLPRSQAMKLSNNTVTGSEYMYVFSGGVAYKNIVEGWGFDSFGHVGSQAYIQVSSGGVASGNTILRAGFLNVYSGGVADSNTVGSAGYMNISSGGVANNNTIAENGHINIYSGGVANNTTVDKGYVEVSGGIANDTVLKSMQMRIFAGGVANNTALEGTIIIYSGGTANMTDANGSGTHVYVSSGGVAINTTVTRGTLDISGGVASNTTVLGSGSMTIHSGSIHKGELQILNQKGITAYTGVTIDFTITDRTVDDGYLLNNWSMIGGRGGIGYTVTANENQAAGTYKLAQGAAAFVYQVWLWVGEVNTSLALTVDGDTVIYAAYEYSLQKHDSDLTLVVKNIEDKEAPTITNIIADITDITNRDVTVTAMFNDDVRISQKQYRIGDGTWIDYVDGIIVSGNGTVYLRARDTAGNETTAQYIVSNIDKEAPTITDITQSTIAPTNQNITLTANFNDNVALAGKQYRIGVGQWEDYTGPIVITDNITVHFKALDTAGNETITQHVVSNIDRSAPTITGIAPDITAATNKDVTVTADFADDVGVAVRQYKIDNGSWCDYIAGATMTANGTVYFRAVDVVGNETIVQYTVSNIDRTAPTITLTPSSTALTNLGISVRADFVDNVALASKMYKINDGAWENYVFDVDMTANGTVYFKGIDTAGNETFAQYVVDNIDKTLPTITDIIPSTTEFTNQNITMTAHFADNMALASQQYKTGNGNWIDYTGSIIIADNTTVYFKAVDAAGNEAIAQYIVFNIDRVAPTISNISSDITAATNADIILTALFSDNVGVATRQYKIDDGAWNDYTAGATVKDNGVVYFRAVDIAGNETIAQYTVSNIDKTAPVLNGAVTARQNNYNMTVSWLPASDNAGVAGYFLKIGGQTYNLKGTTYTISNMAIGSYACQLQAYDTAGNKSEWSEETSFVVQDITAPVLKGDPSASVKGFSADISWKAASDNIGVAGYNVWLNNEKFTTQGTQFSFKTLASGSYTYQLEVYDAAGNSTWSTKKTFRIMADGSDDGGPGLVSPVATVAKYNATLKWAKPFTLDGTVKVVQYEVRLNGEILTVKNASLALKNLALGEYTYSVRALDSQGLYGGWSEEKTFLVRDVTAPVVKNVTTNFSGYALNVSWIGEDKVGTIASYTIKLDGVVREILSGSANSVRLQLSANDVGKHNVEIIAFDGFNYSKAVKKAVTVADITPPDQVVGLSNADVRDAKYTTTLGWNVAVDNSGTVSGYLIELDGKFYKSAKNTIKVSKLSVGEHTYRVMALDKAKNESVWSDAVAFMVYDVTAPGKVSAKGKVTDNSLAVSWKAVKDNVGVAFYEVWGGESANGMSLLAQLNADQFNFQFESLQKGNFFYGICAVDAAGNASVLKASKAVIKTDLAAVDAPLLGYEKNSPLGGLLA